jgi:hypothetical protein
MLEILFGIENLAQKIFKRRFPHRYLAGSLASFSPVSFFGFFVLFCDVAKVAIIQEKTSQILLYNRSEIFKINRKLPYSWLPPRTYHNDLVIWKKWISKSGKLWPFYLSKRSFCFDETLASTIKQSTQ